MASQGNKNTCILVFERKRKYSAYKEGSSSHSNDTNSGFDGDHANIPALAIGENECDKGINLVYCVICCNTYHLCCVNPPLESMPEGDYWVCPNCCDDDITESLNSKKAKKPSSSCSICLKGKRKMTWSPSFPAKAESSKSKEFDLAVEFIISACLQAFGLNTNLSLDNQGKAVYELLEKHAGKVLSEDIKMKNKDIAVVYQRRRKGTASGKELAYPNESTALDLGCVIPKTDVKIKREIGEDGSYLDCDICGDAGELICCDFCPCSYHIECLALMGVPEGKWKCLNCWLIADPPKSEASSSKGN